MGGKMTRGESVFLTTSPAARREDGTFWLPSTTLWGMDLVEPRTERGRNIRRSSSCSLLRRRG